MSTFRVPVVLVRAIEEIPGADKIELAVVGDYRSVIQKGQFKVGDIAIYIPEGALLPAELTDMLGLTGKLAGSGKNRVKAISLRGCLSQGILMEPLPTTEPQMFTEDYDWADALGINKYEPVIPTHMEGEIAQMFGLTLSYDIENIKAYPDVFQDGELVEFTEKVHGTFCAITQYPGQQFDEMIDGDTLVYSKGYGQKGLVLKDNEANQNNLYVRTVKEFEIPQRMRLRGPEPHRPFTLLGEIFGAGVQDLQYGHKKPSFAVFDMYVGEIGHGYFANRYTVEYFAHRMGLPRVPVLYRGAFSRDDLDYHTNGPTVAGSQAHIREGVVVTPVAERFEPKLGRVILKSVSQQYLFRKGTITEFA